MDNCCLLSSQNQVFLLQIQQTSSSRHIALHLRMWCFEMTEDHNSVLVGMFLLISLSNVYLTCQEEIGTNFENDRMSIVLNEEHEEMLPKADPLSMIEQGMHLAGKSIGLLTSQGIFSQMISTLTSAVKKNGKRQDAKRDKIDMTGPVTGILDQLVKMLRLDSNSKLQAVALNAVVFIAQMIDSSLAINSGRNSNEYSNIHHKNLDDETLDGSPLRWVIENIPKDVEENLILSRQLNLPEQLMTTLEENPSAGICMRHLVCRLSPIIWGMQKATRHLFIQKESSIDESESKVNNDHSAKHGNEKNIAPLQLMFSEMPTMEKYTERMKHCEKILPPCKKKL